jgi:hypothetical protein
MKSSSHYIVIFIKILMLSLTYLYIVDINTKCKCDVVKNYDFDISQKLIFIMYGLILLNIILLFIKGKINCKLHRYTSLFVTICMMGIWIYKVFNINTYLKNIDNKCNCSNIDYDLNIILHIYYGIAIIGILLLFSSIFYYTSSQILC